MIAHVWTERDQQIVCARCGVALRQSFGVGCKRQNKYNARKTRIGDLTFDSKAEADRFLELRAKEWNGEIFSLRRQVPFPLVVNGEHCGVYLADFAYENEAGKTVYEDVKGVRTDLYILKRKLVRAIHGIEIQEIG